MSHGFYCLFLNSGDVLHCNEVVDFLLHSCQAKEYDILCGTRKNIYSENKSEIINPVKNVTIELLFHGTISHCSTLIRRSLLLKYPYDEHFRIISDLHFFRQLFLNENKLKYSVLQIKQIVTDFDMSGISTSQSNLCSKEAIESGKILLGERLNKEFTSFIYGKNFIDAMLCRMRWSQSGLYCLYIWCIPLVMLYKTVLIVRHLPYIISHQLHNK